MDDKKIRKQWEKFNKNSFNKHKLNDMFLEYKKLTVSHLIF